MARRKSWLRRRSALFCICIAFVPLLSLGGVAGYLFRPLAMAVVFAMIASYILTYTLVPTMAHFLLRNQHHHSTRSDDGQPPPKGFFARFQHGFEHYFERLRQGYLGLLELALHHRFVVRRRLPSAYAWCLFAWRLSSGRISSLDRCWRDQNSHARAHRNADRGNDASDRSGRTENPRADSARPDHRHRRQRWSAEQRHQYFIWKIPARSACSTRTYRSA